MLLFSALGYIAPYQLATLLNLFSFMLTSIFMILKEKEFTANSFKHLF